MAEQQAEKNVFLIHQYRTADDVAQANNNQQQNDAEVEQHHFASNNNNNRKCDKLYMAD